MSNNKVTVIGKQNPHAVVMVRPLAFSTNEETANDNFFQVSGSATDQENAVREFDHMVQLLREAGVTVHVFDEPRAETPDAVFPNNWFSTHHDGSLVLYPMYAPSRRLERREDILDELRSKYETSQTLDLSPYEHHNAFLEGTGVLVFDHEQKTVFMARSHRADEGLLDSLAAELDYEPLCFDAVDREGRPIYHTNVMMGVGEKTIIIGTDTISNDEDRTRVMNALEKTGRVLIELDHTQIENFAGNMLEVDGKNGPVLVMSERAFKSLTADQVSHLRTAVTLVTPPLPTIEKSGGSARCMMAGVHLPLK